MTYQSQPVQRGADSVLVEKWSLEVMGRGYTAVPDVLLSHMGDLKLSPTELAVLLQLMRFWWVPKQLPFPSKRTIAKALGSSEKNVQKVVGRLEARGLLKRVTRRISGDRNDTNCYDLDPLVNRLRLLVTRDQEAFIRSAQRAMDPGPSPWRKRLPDRPVDVGDAGQPPPPRPPREYI